MKTNSKELTLSKKLTLAKEVFKTLTPFQLTNVAGGADNVTAMETH